MAYIFSIIQQSLYHLWRFMERGIIDGAIFEEDEIDPTEIYRDKVLFFFFYIESLQIYNILYEIWNYKNSVAKKRKKEKRGKYTCFH